MPSCSDMIPRRKYSAQDFCLSPQGLAQVQLPLNQTRRQRVNTMKPPIVLSSPQISVMVNGAVIVNEVEALSWRQQTVADVGSQRPTSIRVKDESRLKDSQSVHVIGLRMVAAGDNSTSGDGSMNGGGPLTIRVRSGAEVRANGDVNNHVRSNGHGPSVHDDGPFDHSDDDVSLAPDSLNGELNGHHDELDYSYNEEERPTSILSRRGTIRGKKNHVRASIAALLEQKDTSKRQYTKEEEGKIVLYTTSMGIVRRTHDHCRRVRNILQTLMVRFDERDVFMNRDYQDEVKERLSVEQVLVPQVFVEGRFLGNADIVERLNECGELRRLLEPYKRLSVGGMCKKCGDFRFLPCTTCGGSKKSAQHKHQFSMDFIALRCMVCDENGLIKCDLCLNSDLY